MEVDLHEGRGADQADARRRGRAHPAAAAEPLHRTYTVGPLPSRSSHALSSVNRFEYCSQDGGVLPQETWNCFPEIVCSVFSLMISSDRRWKRADVVSSVTPEEMGVVFQRLLGRCTFSTNKGKSHDAYIFFTVLTPPPPVNRTFSPSG